jgi:hypothetical protein
MDQRWKTRSRYIKYSNNMKTLHSIQTPFIFSDMALANLWIAQSVSRIAKLRYNLDNQNPISEDYRSPIEYWSDYDGTWIKWWWETYRLAEWDNAGNPEVDTTNIEVGHFG